MSLDQHSTNCHSCKSHVISWQLYFLIHINLRFFLLSSSLLLPLEDEYELLRRRVRFLSSSLSLLELEESSEESVDESLDESEDDDEVECLRFCRLDFSSVFLWSCLGPELVRLRLTSTTTELINPRIRLTAWPERNDLDDDIWWKIWSLKRDKTIERMTICRMLIEWLFFYLTVDWATLLDKIFFWVAKSQN